MKKGYFKENRFSSSMQCMTLFMPFLSDSYFLLFSIWFVTCLSVVTYEWSRVITRKRNHPTLRVESKSFNVKLRNRTYVSVWRNKGTKLSCYVRCYCLKTHNAQHIATFTALQLAGRQYSLCILLDDELVSSARKHTPVHCGTVSLFYKEIFIERK